MKSFKGFNKDLTCKGFHYTEGQTYEIPEDDINLCTKGFHSCIIPIQCYYYYFPIGGVFHEVDIDGAMDISKSNSKIVSSKITIGEEICTSTIIERSFDYITIMAMDPDQYVGTVLEQFAFSICESLGKGSIALSSEDFSIASSVKEDEAYNGAVINLGHNSIAASVLNHKDVATSGNQSISASVGNNNMVIASGNKSVATSIGKNNIVMSSNEASIGVAIGNSNKVIAEKAGSMVIVSGNDSIAKGALGSYITFVIMTENEDRSSHISNVISIYIDGTRYKANTWYKVENNTVKLAK